MTTRRAGASLAVRAAHLACEEALKALRSTTDLRERTTAAAAFAQVLRDYANEAAAVRREAVAGMCEAGKLSLAQAARELGISKARAAQMVDAARLRRDVEPKPAGVEDIWSGE